jgi:hypothetical protein
MRGFFDLVKAKLGFEDQYGNVIKTSRKKFTAAQVKLLFTTPQTLVSAPGDNKYIQVEKVVAFLDFEGAAFAGANNLEVRETNGAGTKVTADLDAAFLNSAADALTEVSGIEAQTTRLLDKAIVLAVPTADPTGVTATSTLTVFTFYRVVRVH